jgi:hypothetical protein
MDFWDYLQYGSWAVAGLLVLWMLADAVMVSSQFTEDVLTSSQEGIDELVAQQQAHNAGKKS